MSYAFPGEGPWTIFVPLWRVSSGLSGPGAVLNAVHRILVGTSTYANSSPIPIGLVKDETGMSVSIWAA